MRLYLRLPCEVESIFGIPRLSPMLASPGEAPFSDDSWSFEIKWDGYRCLAYLSEDGCYLDSRNRKPLLPKFPKLTEMHLGLSAPRVLLDGEIVAFRDGKVDFSYLRTEPNHVVFVAFDLLYLDERLLVDEPLSQRQALLEGVYSWSKTVSRSQTVAGQGEVLYEWVRERGMEGMVGKRNDSVYVPGKRSRDWIKVRNVQEGRFWVVGYMPGAGRKVGSLVVAGETDGRLSIVGRVSSGLNRRYEKWFQEKLEPIDASAVEDGGNGRGAGSGSDQMKKIRWVKPFYGVQVHYTEMTPDGRLRHPVLREVLAEAPCTQ